MKLELDKVCPTCDGKGWHWNNGWGECVVCGATGIKFGEDALAIADFLERYFTLQSRPLPKQEKPNWIPY